MSNFEEAYNVTRKIEGGYHNASGINSADRGGETFKGIARKYWPTWKGWVIVDSHKNRPGFPKTAEQDPELSRLVRDFFKVNFWDPLRLDQISFKPVASELFDTAVNAGVKTAALFFQKSLNLLNRNGKSWKEIAEDGKIGPQTLISFTQLSPEDKANIYNTLNLLQGRHYLNLAEKDPRQEEFLRGWFKRVQFIQL